MVGYLRSLVGLVVVSGAGWCCPQETLDGLLHGFFDWLPRENYEQKIIHLEHEMKELHRQDILVLNRVGFKKEVVMALYRGEITPLEAASCFHHIFLHGGKGSDPVLSQHQGLAVEVRAGLCMMLWLNDMDCPGLLERPDVVEFSRLLGEARVNTAILKLPLPPVRILADHFY